MNKPKAPKDMTAPEFVDYLQKRVHERVTDKTLINDGSMTAAFIVAFAKGLLSEPAPNPFTPDQVATMREIQRNGFDYAAKDKDGDVWIYRETPYKTDIEWLTKCNYEKDVFNIFDGVTSWDDTEPLCFADYAPLEGEQP